MNKLDIAGTRNSPLVIFHESENKFDLKGVSCMTDARSFYQPVIDWVIQSSAEIKTGIVFEFYLPYFNSGSNKGIFRLLESISGIVKSGKECRIVWCVEEEDEFMSEGGEVIENILGLKFEFKQVPFDAKHLF
jgi:hypothetical protein